MNVKFKLRLRFSKERDVVSKEYFTISQVAEMLNEFPDLTISSLRFLEREGLVTPERTAGGHRRYTQTDVERVRFVKEMQRRFFPLNVIGEMLRHANHKKGKGEKLFFRPLHYDPGFSPLGRAELTQASGLDEARLAEMEALGMIGPSAEGQYDEDDLQAASVMKGLVEYGLEPADLAFYLEHMEAIVEEEMRLMLTKIVSGRGIAETLHVEELTDELRRVLHAKLLRQAGHQLSDQFKRHFEER